MKKRVIFLPAILGLLLAGCVDPDSFKTSIPGILPGEPCSESLESNDDLPPEISLSSTEESTLPISGESSLQSSDSCSCSDEEEESNSNGHVPDFPPGVRKPIIYFYPEEEMDLSVTFVNEEMLTTTYPKYDGGWNIHLKEDGTFTVPGSDREYYGLYYESVPNYECTFETGFYVTGENAASFLEEKMDYMGFNNRETDEFIMYWLPILERNEQSLVYFEETEERNEESPLIFSTAPDTLIRTCIHIKKVNAPIDMVPQELTHVERTGFTVTEWGGLEH